MPPQTDEERDVNFILDQLGPIHADLPPQNGPTVIRTWVGDEQKEPDKRFIELRFAA